METYGEALLQLKRHFLIIGLTGYTGSGCTTAAKLLNNDNKLELPGLNLLSNGIDERRYQKLKNVWNELLWEKFVNIEISRIIFLFVIHRALNTSLDNLQINTARRIASENRDFTDGINYLLDVNCNINDKEVATEVVASYEQFKNLYINFKNACKLNLSSFIEEMQNYGDQIRTFGKVFPEKDDSKEPKNIFLLPRSIRRLVKSYIVSKECKYFVLDAFRNPYEVEYFKKRYSEFYVVSIQRSIQQRRDALNSLSGDAIEKIEKREKGKLIQDKSKDNIHKWVTSQNITECSQKADYFIPNHFDRSKTSPYLRYHLIRLMCLTQIPGCISPTNDERCMQLAMSSRQNSGCMSRHVGAIVANKKGYVLGVGWNDPPSGQVPCALRSAEELISNLDKNIFSEYETSEIFIKHITKRNHGNKPFCFKDELALIEGKKSNEFTRSLHAEENALLQAMIHGADTVNNSILYTTDSPCTLCSKKAYHLGVKKIVYLEEYPGISLTQSIKVGEMPIEIKQFEGACGAAFFKLFSPLMPEKDFIMIYT